MQGSQQTSRAIPALGLAFLAAAAPMSAEAAHHRKIFHLYQPPTASIVVDAKTGAVLEEADADAPRHPASMTKLMTLMLTFDALRDGRLTMNTPIVISSHAAAVQPSKLNLRAGQTITVADAIPAMAVHSANDVATAMGEALGGSEAGFARLMNTKAASLGMRDTTFVNASGLPDQRQMTTARDMAILCERMIADYAEFYHYFSQPEFDFAGASYRNHNRLLFGYGHGRTSIPAYPGLDGLKTGLTDMSGANLAASAVQNQHRLIGVVFGGASVITRDQEMTALLNQAFAAVAAQDAVKARSPVIVLPDPQKPLNPPSSPLS